MNHQNHELQPTASPSLVSQSPAVNKLPRKRQNVYVACNTCRAKKLGCNGRRPKCAFCAARELDCVYDADGDSTRATTLKRKYAELQQETSDLRTLLDVLCSRPLADAQAILEHLRLVNDVQDTLEFASQASTSLHPGLNASSAAASPSKSSNPSEGWDIAMVSSLFIIPDMTGHELSTLKSDPRMSIETLTSSASQATHKRVQPDDTLLFSKDGHRVALGVDVNFLSEKHPWIDERLSMIDPKLWTTVPISTIALANLISLYISWRHPYYTSFDERFFLEDLISGDTNHCTPVLVNCIACSACMLYVQLDPTVESMMGRRFFNEAQRLWKEDLAQPTVNSVSAACIMNSITMYHNNDKLGMGMLYNGWHIAKQLGMFRDHRRPRYETPKDQHEAKLLQAKAVAAWGLYNLSTMYGLFYPVAPICRKEPYLPAYSDEYDCGRHWIPWPCSKRLDHVPARYRYLCTLTPIVHDAVAFRYRLLEAAIISKEFNDPISYRMALVLLQRLLNWSRDLPASLGESKNCSPAILEMLMIPHAVILEIFRPFVIKDKFAADLYAVSARQVVLLCCDSRSSFGGPPNLATSIGYVHKGAYAALQSLGKDPDAERFFINCIEIMHELSPSGILPGRILLSLLLAAREKFTVLPDRAREMLEQLMCDDTRAKAFDDSMFMIDLDVMMRDPQAASVESLTRRAQDLNIS